MLANLARLEAARIPTQNLPAIEVDISTYLDENTGEILELVTLCETVFLPEEEN